MLRVLGGLPLAAAGCRSSARGPGGPPVAFRPLAPGPFPAPARVVLYGDSRGKLPIEFWREDTGGVPEMVIAQAVAERPDLVIHGGDLVESASPASWSAFDEEIEPLRAAGVPFFPILGNHEFVGEGDPRAALARYFARFPGLGRQRWYELRVGPLAYLLVDTNRPELSDAETRAQAEWYAERLARAEADPSVRWVVVVAHHPPMTNAVLHKPDPFVREAFVEPALRSPKVAAVVAGHVHAYERFLVEGRHVVVTGGGGSPRVNVLHDHRWPAAYRGPCERAFHYLRFDVRPDRCDVDVMMLDLATCSWAVGDRFSLCA